ncbi:hypothetical protein ACNPON_17460 [Glutamicibacter sp. AGC13]
MTATPATIERGLTFKESSHRYKLDGQPVSGVTTIIGGGVPKPALVWWAGTVVAQWVLDPINSTHLTGLQSGYTGEKGDPSLKFLQLLPNRERDAAAKRGTAVHDLAEQINLTGGADVPEDLEGFIEGYLAFLEEWQITPVLAEVIVGSREHWYSGKVDLFAQSPLLQTAEEIAAGWVIEVDLKTSKGVYMDTALQTAAYARAEFYMDGEIEKPIPPVSKAFVAHVTPMDREGENARYGDEPLGTSLYLLSDSPEKIDEHFQHFLHAKAVHEDAKVRGKIKLEPLTVPALNAA